MARFIYPIGSGGGLGDADIADFIFINEDENNSKVTLPINKEITIETTRDDDGDADININSADDIFINAYGDDVVITAFNEVRIDSNDGEYEWRFADTGCLELPSNGEICNIPDSSGDGYGYSTISIVPDNNLESDQYLIIDPTAPNHIHIRAGGEQDNSSASLILGGEMNNVYVEDGARQVSINTRPARIENSYLNINTSSSTEFVSTMPVNIETGYTVNADGTDYEVTAVTLNSPAEGLVAVTATGLTFAPGTPYTFFYESPFLNGWQFNSDGVLLGPAMGSVAVNGIFNNHVDSLYLNSSEGIILDASDGEFLHDNNNPNNQIATIGDVDTAVGATLYHGSFYDIQDQTGTANSIQAMKLRQTDFSSGVSIGGANNTQITIANAGIYNIAFSAQLHQTNSSGTINIWLNKNGTPMANTNTKVAITSNNPFYVAAWNLFVDADAADYFELMWSSTSANTVIEHEAETGTGPTLHPAVPSVIVTVNKVS